MIDNFSILLSHALLLIAFWYLTLRDDLDVEAPPTPDPEPKGFTRTKPRPEQISGQIKRPSAHQDAP
jgi:hypothetical protein